MIWIDAQFPAVAGKYNVTSNPDGNYNCIAFAAGDTTRWWSHVVGFHWPARRSPFIESLVAVFVMLGYSQCPTADVEDGYEKVALYAKTGFWKHAARQKPNGKWTSKLGQDEDIEHDTPECLCGPHYGTVHCIMRKAKS